MTQRTRQTSICIRPVYARPSLSATSRHAGAGHDATAGQFALSRQTFGAAS